VYDATCIRCRGSVRGGGSRGISAATRGFNGANKNRRKRRLRRATGGGVVGFRSGPGGSSLQGKEMGEAVRNGKNSPELWEKCLTGMWGRTLVSFVLLASASGPAQESRGVSGRRGRVSGVRRWTLGEQ
jgi:hypothetical protein